MNQYQRESYFVTVVLYHSVDVDGLNVEAVMQIGDDHKGAAEFQLKIKYKVEYIILNSFTISLKPKFFKTHP
jgi:hypothetical protein